MGRTSDTRMYSPRSESSHMFRANHEDERTPTGMEDARDKEARLDRKQKKKEEADEKDRKMRHIKVRRHHMGQNKPEDEGPFKPRESPSEPTMPAGAGGFLTSLAAQAKGPGAAGGEMIQMSEPMDAAWSELLKRDKRIDREDMSDDEFMEERMRASASRGGKRDFSNLKDRRKQTGRPKRGVEFSEVQPSPHMISEANERISEMNKVNDIRDVKPNVDSTNFFNLKPRMVQPQEKFGPFVMGEGRFRGLGPEVNNRAYRKRIMEEMADYLNRMQGADIEFDNAKYHPGLSREYDNVDKLREMRDTIPLGDGRHLYAMGLADSRDFATSNPERGGFAFVDLNEEGVPTEYAGYDEDEDKLEQLDQMRNFNWMVENQMPGVEEDSITVDEMLGPDGLPLTNERGEPIAEVQPPEPIPVPELQVSRKFNPHTRKFSNPQPTFQGVPFNDETYFTASEPMENAWSSILKQKRDLDLDDEYGHLTQHPGEILSNPEDISEQLREAGVPDVLPVDLATHPDGYGNPYGKNLALNVGHPAIDIPRMARFLGVSNEEAMKVIQRESADNFRINMMRRDRELLDELGQRPVPDAHGNINDTMQDVGEEPTFARVPFNDETSFTRSEAMDEAWSSLMKGKTKRQAQKQRKKEERKKWRPSTGKFKKPKGGYGGKSGTTARAKLLSRNLPSGKKTGLMKPHLSVEMSHRGIASKQPMSQADPQGYGQYRGYQEQQNIQGNIRPTSGASLPFAQVARPRVPKPRLHPVRAPPIVPPQLKTPHLNRPKMPGMVTMSEDDPVSGDILKAGNKYLLAEARTAMREMKELMRRMKDKDSKKKNMGAPDTAGAASSLPKYPGNNPKQTTRPEGATEDEIESRLFGLDPSGVVGRSGNS